MAIQRRSVCGEVRFPAIEITGTEDTEWSRPAELEAVLETGPAPDFAGPSL